MRRCRATSGLPANASDTTCSSVQRVLGFHSQPPQILSRCRDFWCGSQAPGSTLLGELQAVCKSHLYTQVGLSVGGAAWISGVAGVLVAVVGDLQYGGGERLLELPVECMTEAS